MDDWNVVGAHEGRRGGKVATESYLVLKEKNHYLSVSAHRHLAGGEVTAQPILILRNKKDPAILMLLAVEKGTAGARNISVAHSIRAYLGKIAAPGTRIDLEPADSSTNRALVGRIPENGHREENEDDRGDPEP